MDRNAQSALRWGNLKLVKTWKTGKLELFDLSKDLSEANDLSAKMPEKTKELDQTLTAFLAQVKATPSLKNMSLVTSMRLSVQPVTAEEWKIICKMGGV